MTIQEKLNITVGPLDCQASSGPVYNLTADVEALHQQVDKLQNLIGQIDNSTNNAFDDIIEWKEHVIVKEISLDKQGRVVKKSNRYPYHNQVTAVINAAFYPVAVQSIQAEVADITNTFGSKVYFDAWR